MSIDDISKKLHDLKVLIDKNDIYSANNLINELKGFLLEFESLPPLNIETPNAEIERKLSRDFLEYAVIVSVILEDKEGFERNINSLKPYYIKNINISESTSTPTVLGLNLLYLLVENRLADFHSELELLSDEQLSHPNIKFCTQLDLHLVVGSYDQVLIAASTPPVAVYSFFLKSLLETVRLNVGECIAAAYENLSIEKATKMLMYDDTEDTKTFIQESYPDWEIVSGVINVKVKKSTKSESIPSHRLISQTVTYATELERIV
mmetsp:Transcript_23417/g.21298  ORF Transcript_23417/g.21298 Transcript_23417/m.21298 type:complete len:264 (+) Transcript_23417:43-834(+)